MAETRQAAERILEMNQDAMVRKRDGARRAADRASAAMIATALIASLIGLLVSTALTRRILRPLSVLGQTARRLGEGDMEVRAKVTRQDEIGALAGDFNLMADRLAQYRRSSLGELLQAQQQAQAAIDSLPDPVLIFDLDARLLGANQAAERILRVSTDDAAARRWPAPSRRSGPPSSGCACGSRRTRPPKGRRASTRRCACRAPAPTGGTLSSCRAPRA